MMTFVLSNIWKSYQVGPHVRGQAEPSSRTTLHCAIHHICQGRMADCLFRENR